MFGDFVTKATKNISEYPCFKTENFTSAIRQAVSKIPDVPSIASSNNIVCYARRVNEKVLDMVVTHVPYSSVLAKGANLCGDVASRLPLIRTVTRRRVPTMTVSDHMEEDLLDSPPMLGRFGHERIPKVRKWKSEGYLGNMRKLCGKKDLLTMVRHHFIEYPKHRIETAGSWLSSLFSSKCILAQFQSNMKNTVVQAIMSASTLTLNATGSFFHEFDTHYPRTISSTRAVRYCREKSQLESSQFFLKFALRNISELLSCPAGELLRSLAMFGALQKILGSPYPPLGSLHNLNSEEKDNEFLFLQRIYDFALASYGPLILDILRMNLTSRSVQDLIIRLTKVKKEDILICEVNSKFLEPSFALVLDHKMENIIVTIRGTANVEDCFTDIHAESVPFHVGHAHRGMLCCAQFLDRRLRGIVRNLSRKHAEYNIVITGHSLGGGAATLLAIIWHHDRMFGSRVRGVAFAGAACVTKELSLYCTEFVTSVIYADDIISRLSLRAVENLRHILVAMCSEAGKEQCFDADSISSLIEAYITAGKSTAKRWRRYLERIYVALTSVADKHQSPFQIMYTGGSILCAIPDEDYILHPEKRPFQKNSDLTPSSTHLIKPRKLEPFGEIVCNPAIFLKHFPSNLKDFFRHNKPSEVTSSSGFSSPVISKNASVGSAPPIFQELLNSTCPSISSVLASPRHKSLYNLFSLHEPQVA